MKGLLTAKTVWINALRAPMLHLAIHVNSPTFLTQQYQPITVKTRALTLITLTIQLILAIRVFLHVLNVLHLAIASLVLVQMCSIKACVSPLVLLSITMSRESAKLVKIVLTVSLLANARIVLMVISWIKIKRYAFQSVPKRPQFRMSCLKYVNYVILDANCVIISWIIAHHACLVTIYTKLLAFQVAHKDI